MYYLHELALDRRFVFTHQMAAVFCVKWRHGRHLETVTWNQKLMRQSNRRCVGYLREEHSYKIMLSSQSDLIQRCLRLFWRGHPTKKKNKNKNKKKNNNNNNYNNYNISTSCSSNMSSEMRSVPDRKCDITYATTVLVVVTVLWRLSTGNSDNMTADHHHLHTSRSTRKVEENYFLWCLCVFEIKTVGDTDCSLPYMP